MNEKIMKQAGFEKEVDKVKKGLCPLCAKIIEEHEFRDEKSIREFRISGLCQKCQDMIFD